MQLTKITEFIYKRMEHKLPGEESHNVMMVSGFGTLPVNFNTQEPIPAAVLILLYEQNKHTYIILTKRSEHVQHHKGQISLPGGANEKGETLQETALRETAEELGIEQNSIKIIGNLSPLFVAVTGFIITPFIGVYYNGFTPNPAIDEVEEVITISLETVLDRKNKKRENRKIRGFDVIVPYYSFANHKVWGATAMILSEFETIIKESQNEQSWN